MQKRDLIRMRAFAAKTNWKIQAGHDGAIIAVSYLCTLALKGLDADKPSRRRAKRL